MNFVLKQALKTILPESVILNLVYYLDMYYCIFFVVCVACLMFNFSSPNDWRVDIISVQFKQITQVVCIADSPLQPQVAVFYDPHRNIYHDSHQFICMLINSSHKF